MTTKTRLAIEAALEAVQGKPVVSVSKYHDATVPANMRQLLQEHDAQIREAALKAVSDFGQLQNALDRVKVLEDALKTLEVLIGCVDTYARLKELHEMGFGTDHDATRRRFNNAVVQARAALTQTQPKE